MLISRLVSLLLPQKRERPDDAHFFCVCQLLLLLSNCWAADNNNGAWPVAILYQSRRILVDKRPPDVTHSLGNERCPIDLEMQLKYLLQSFLHTMYIPNHSNYSIHFPSFDLTWSHVFQEVRKSWDTMRLIGPKMEDTHAILSNDSCRQIQLTKAGGNPEYMDAKKSSWWCEEN